MKKSIYRSLAIMSIFVGVTLLLLPLQVFARIAPSLQAVPTPEATETPTNYPPLTATVPMTATQPISPSVGIDAPAGLPECPIPDKDNCVFLPIVFGRPFLLLDGRIKLVEETNRVKGLTVFRPIASELITVTLNFEEVQFSEDPQWVKAWLIGQDEKDIDFINYSVNSITVTLGSTPSFGAQHVMVKFRGGSTEIPMGFTFFYIPDGDFQVSNIPVPSDGSYFWESNSTQDGKVEIADSRLKLGSNSEDCSNVGIEFAAASIDLELPSDGEYHLNVDGIVYTQDQNPSNSATFDAFEIVINGNVVDRYSNQDQPIRCEPVINRQVVVDARIPLSNYSGNTTISLENHRRYDNQFDTYTEIDMVWIDY